MQLSVLLNMPGDFALIEKTVRKVCAQTARAEVELVIATTPDQVEQIDTGMFAGLGAWQIVTLPSMPNGAAGWAAAARAAKAPVIVLAEDHSFPEANWAAELIRAHAAEYPAVSPTLRNANPSSAVSCANYLQCFLDWIETEEDRALAHGAGHNTSYKVAALRPYMDRLEHWLNPERVLHLEFEAHGHKCLHAAKAATHHVNISLPGGHLMQSFDGGRVFGESRASAWPLWRKIVFAGGAWLVPPLRLMRIYKTLATQERREAARFWPALPWLVLGLTCHATGEAIGYLFGAGSSQERYKHFESDRMAWVLPEERVLWQDHIPPD